VGLRSADEEGLGLAMIASLAIQNTLAPRDCFPSGPSSTRSHWSHRHPSALLHLHLHQQVGQFYLEPDVRIKMAVGAIGPYDKRLRKSRCLDCAQRRVKVCAKLMITQWTRDLHLACGSVQMMFLVPVASERLWSVVMHLPASLQSSLETNLPCQRLT